MNRHNKFSSPTKRVVLNLIGMALLSFFCGSCNLQKQSSEMHLALGSGGGTYQDSDAEVNKFNAYSLKTVTRSEYEDNKRIDLHSNVFLGWNEQAGKDFFLSVNQSFTYHTTWLGIGGGYHLGFLNVMGEPFDGIFFPSFNLRLGPEHLLFADFRIADNFPASMPATLFKVGLGTGFGNRYGSRLTAGLCPTGFYLEPYWLVGSNTVIHPFFSYRDENNYQFALSLHFILGS